MSILTEQKVLASITYNKIANTIDVKWVNKIFRDGIEITSSPHCCSYSKEDKIKLQLDLGIDAPLHLSITDW